MTDITIPPAALEAGARAMQRAEPWSSFWSQEDAQKLARAAFLAIVEAWPGMRHAVERNGSYPVAIIPLMENTNDQA